MLVDEQGRLSGIFTDSDLARLFEHRRDGELDHPIRNVMTKNPLRVEVGSMMVDAVAIMAGRKISELPVVDAAGKPVGLIDITDVVALLPKRGRRIPRRRFRRNQSRGEWWGKPDDVDAVRATTRDAAYHYGAQQPARHSVRILGNVGPCTEP